MKKIVLCFGLFMLLTISIGLTIKKNDANNQDVVMNYNTQNKSTGQDVVSRLHEENKRIKDNKKAQSKFNSKNAEDLAKEIEKDKQLALAERTQEELKIKQSKENEKKKEKIEVDNVSISNHLNKLNEISNTEIDDNEITTTDKINTLNDNKVLAKSISAEGAGRTFEEKVAIGSVLLNRVKDDRFPNTLKEVVKETNSYKNGYFNICITTETDIKASGEALDGKSGVNGALYYYSGSNEQRNGLEYIKTVGDLSFYK